MSATHTPGPWKVNATPHSSNQNFVVLDSGANGHSKRVCAVYSDNDEADARLIAAAPDLLSALELVEKAIRGEMLADMLVGLNGPTLATVVNDALAKARGES